MARPTGHNLIRDPLLARHVYDEPWRWFEDALGIVVPEFGILPYYQMPPKRRREGRKKT